MPKSIFERQKELIESLKVKILLLVDKYRKCREKLSFDYLSSKVSESIYLAGLNKSLIEYNPEIPEQYQLSQDEIDFLKNNADLSKDGNVTLRVINQKHIKKKELLDKILQSIQIPYYLSSLSEKDQKNVFAEAVTNYYNGLIIKQENTIKVYQERYHERCEIFIEYNNAIKKRNDLLHKKNSFLKRLNNSTADNFMDLVKEFYQLDLSYYDWYIKKDQEEQNKSTGINHSFKRKDKNSPLEEVSSNVDDLIDIVYLLRRYNDNLHNFVEEALTIERRSPQHSLYEGENYNYLFLYELFLKHAKLKEFIPFLESLSPSSDIEEAFKKYFLSLYGEKRYIKKAEFLRKLRCDVVGFYEKEINRLNETLENKHLQIKNDLKDLKRESNKSVNYINKSLRQSQVGKAYFEGLTEEEQEELYEDLKNILSNIPHLNKGENLTLKLNRTQRNA